MSNDTTASDDVTLKQRMLAAAAVSPDWAKCILVTYEGLLYWAEIPVHNQSFKLQRIHPAVTSYTTTTHMHKWDYTHIKALIGNSHLIILPKVGDVIYPIGDSWGSVFAYENSGKSFVVDAIDPYDLDWPIAIKVQTNEGEGYRSWGREYTTEPVVKTDVLDFENSFNLKVEIKIAVDQLNSKDSTEAVKEQYYEYLRKLLALSLKEVEKNLK